MDEEESVLEVIRRIKERDDYFEILNLERNSSEREVTLAYRRLALILHPDKCNVEGGEAAFKKVAEAFACLREPSTRELYERYGSTGSLRRVSTRVDPQDIFREMFEAMNKQQFSEDGRYYFRYGSFNGGMYSSSRGESVLLQISSFNRFSSAILFVLFLFTFFYMLSYIWAFLVHFSFYYFCILTFFPSRFKVSAVLLVTFLGAFHII